MDFDLRQRADGESRLRRDADNGGRNPVLEGVLPGSARSGGIEWVLRYSEVPYPVIASPGNLHRTKRRLHKAEDIGVVGAGERARRRSIDQQISGIHSSNGLTEGDSNLA